MKRSEPDLSWGVQQRLEFIEFRLYWEGGVNRSDITGRFGVSVPQASQDLSRYQALAPRNIFYDRSMKRYVKTQKFSPQFLRLDADRYLSQLRSIAEGGQPLDETWLSECPSSDALCVPHRSIQVEILRAILEAVRNRKSIEVLYQSLTPTRPKPSWFWISPHAFAFDGNRWHTRAFVHRDQQFADFLLPRFLEVKNTGAAEAGATDDATWNEIVTIDLKPHPRLNSDQKSIVAQDFGMKSGRLSVPVRLALLYYFLRRLHLDFHSEEQPPHEQHLVLANPVRVRDLLARARLV